MFIGTYQEFLTNQSELHKRAAHQRLLKSFEKPNPWLTVVFTCIGKLLVVSGQQIINRYQTAQ
ncbi:MAG: hypothetical protein MUO54_04785 [Anaerolineales bacterium]|nr:hypothetical protein [Anaerolineales bacterium]